mgnify:CR=1 FL=1
MATDLDPREIARATSALTDNPTDLGHWLEVGSLLASAQRAEAGEVFAALGDVANALGQTALAVACARWLDQHEHAARGAALLDAVATTHCHGSTAIDLSARPVPPGRAKPPAPRAAPAGVAQDVARDAATVPTATLDNGSGKSGKRGKAGKHGKGAHAAPRTDAALTLTAAATAATAAVEQAAVAARGRAPANLPPTALVHALAADDFRALISMSRLRALASGTEVVTTGQPADALYWVARGRLEVSRDGALLGELRSNAFFGEIALVGGTSRTATVTCAEDTWLLEIPASHIEAVAAKAPRLATVLASHARARLLANVLRTSELFSRLGDDERAQLLPRFTTYLAEPGTTIIACGAENEPLYVVVSGRCEVRDGDAVLATVGVGDGVGEMSLIARRPAVADVVAVERTALLRLPRSDFEQFAVNHPGLLAELYKVLLEREQRNKALVIHDATELVV